MQQFFPEKQSFDTIKSEREILWSLKKEPSFYNIPIYQTSSIISVFHIFFKWFKCKEFQVSYYFKRHCFIHKTWSCKMAFIVLLKEDYRGKKPQTTALDSGQQSIIHSETSRASQMIYLHNKKTRWFVLFFWMHDSRFYDYSWGSWQHDLIQSKNNLRKNSWSMWTLIQAYVLVLKYE